MASAWMRNLYTLIFYLALPLILFRLYWRGCRAPAYRQRWRERLACYQSQPLRDVIWFHAVSVGEAEAAFPLIKLMGARHPDARFLVTTTTPTGSARVRAVLADSVEHVYLPYDLPPVLNRFFQHFRPRMAVFMEKEVWPNLFAACRRRNIPLYVINARLSERSASAYRRIPWLIKPALDCATMIATQTDEDRARFVDIGARDDRVAILGNIKFDIDIDHAVIEAGQALRSEQLAGRFVWILASTHHDEEALLLPVYRELKSRIPELLLMIAPRHPERFVPVEQLCKDHGLEVIVRSRHAPVTATTDIYLADSMGELKMLYAASDVAFVGGSLVPVGGHNVLEPAAVGVPVLFGPQMFNFEDIALHILAAKAALRCDDPQAIVDAVLKIHVDPTLRSELIANAKDFVRRNQGATARLAALLARGL